MKLAKTIASVFAFTFIIWLFYVAGIKPGIVVFSFMAGAYSILAIHDLLEWYGKKQNERVTKNSISLNNKRFLIAAQHLSELELTVRHHFSEYGSGNMAGEVGSKKHDFICSNKKGKRSRWVFIFKDDFTFTATKTGEE